MSMKAIYCVRKHTRVWKHATPETCVLNHKIGGANSTLRVNFLIS